MNIKDLLPGSEKAKEDDDKREALLENLHRVAASQAPGSYHLLCEALPLKAKK